MSGSRTKRQFAGAASDPAQRQITSFFNKSSSSSSSPAGQNGRLDVIGGPISNDISPALPAHIQANLLSVGMRVRKSVPEGYKTGTYSGFSLWSDNNNTTSASDVRPVPAVPGGGAGSGGRRELAPFCGIHKIGGLAVQPSHHESASLDYMPSIPGMDSAPSSQESTTSTTSAVAMQDSTAAAMNRKRFFVTEEEEEEQEQEEQELQKSGQRAIISWRNRADWLDGEISPRSLAPAGWPENSRVMAVPKRSAGKSSGGGAGLLPPGAPVPADGDQENMVVDDFEEAPFLDYRIGRTGSGMDLE